MTAALIVDDEPQMRKFLRIALSTRGYRVIEAETAEEGIRQAATNTPDFVLLDLGLPDKDGIEVVKTIRSWTRTPILVISASGQEERKVIALDEGADDYLTKPFGVSELLARIRVSLRNAALTRDTTSTVVKIGDDIELDLARRIVTRKGAEVHLTPNEYKLLTTLVQHANKVLTHRQLLQQVWGPRNAERVEYLRVYMTQLRGKLEDEPAQPKYLRTELGVGYRLKLDS